MTNNAIRFKVPVYEDVPVETRAVFDQFKKLAGKLPNLYATIGYSANALSSYMTLVHAQAQGTFRGKDREAIYLIVSQLNGCEYCLSSHTISAIKFGWTENETLLLRTGSYEERKWQVVFLIIQSVITNKGEVSDELLSEYFEIGYNETGLIDLMLLINIMTFTNYTYRLTKIPIDYPLAKPVNIDHGTTPTYETR